MKKTEDIIVEYNKLLEDVKTNPYYTKINLDNRVNVYTCPKNHQFKTIDKDAGVTPAMKSCPTCGDFASSNFYKDSRPDLTPSYEWYRPTLEETLRLSTGELEHVLQGGLLFREIK